MVDGEVEDVWCMRGASEETVRGREVLLSLCLIERREKGKGKGLWYWFRT